MLGTIALVALATVPLEAPPANPGLYVGGLLGGFVVVVSAASVQTLGVLRLGPATVAGQATGALLIDLIAPAPGEVVTVGDRDRRHPHDRRGGDQRPRPASGAGELSRYP